MKEIMQYFVTRSNGEKADLRFLSESKKTLPMNDFFELVKFFKEKIKTEESYFEYNFFNVIIIDNVKFFTNSKVIRLDSIAVNGKKYFLTEQYELNPNVVECYVISCC